MNRRQRNAVFALYRTLLRRRWHRLGPTMKSLGALLMALSAVAAGGVFLLALLLGLFLLPNATPVAVLWTWDGVLLAFLFFRVWGMATDLRVDDVLSMQNLLHLPLAPSDVFILNTIALHLQPSPLIFGAALLGLSLASIFALGPGHAILLPLAVASFWCVIALTRQMQTFLAALMVNKRRRGTIVAVSFIVGMLLIQAPNIFMQVQYWGERDRMPGERVKVETLDPGEASQRLLATNLALPPGWLAYGAYQAKQDRYWPAAAGTLGLLVIVGWSLRRSYRSALRVYRLTERARVSRSGGRASGPRARRRRIAEAYWSVFAPIPAAVGRASLRQWVRSPQGKQALLAPLAALLLVVLATLRFEDVSKAQPYLGLGLAALCSPVVFISNVFGWDRGGFRVLLATDPPRQLVLLGKNLGLVPITLGPGIGVVVAVQLLWPQPVTHLLASILQIGVFCLVWFMMGNHFSITAPWAASFMSLKQRGPASSTAVFLAAVFAVGAIMLATAGVLALERLVADAGWPVPLYLISSILELGLAAAWYRRAQQQQAETMPAAEERILEAINTPVD
ncbi:MAG: hypothetical protein OXQ90_11425 [Gammaproteobacteria bacterium]|nr:hypothetical protein [Gammaproteobacteria bacterium]